MISQKITNTFLVLNDDGIAKLLHSLSATAGNSSSWLTACSARRITRQPLPRIRNPGAHPEYPSLPRPRYPNPNGLLSTNHILGAPMNLPGCSRSRNSFSPVPKRPKTPTALLVAVHSQPASTSPEQPRSSLRRKLVLRPQRPNFDLSSQGTPKAPICRTHTR